MRRIEERFAGVNGSGTKPSVLQSYNYLNDPLPCIESFSKTYPLATQQLLSADDSGFFLAVSQRRGQKPVPFIPVLDASFEVWFKKVFLAFSIMDIISYAFSFYRILYGLQRTSRPSLIRIPSVSVSCRALLQ